MLALATTVLLQSAANLRRAPVARATFKSSMPVFTRCAIFTGPVGQIEE